MCFHFLGDLWMLTVCLFSACWGTCVQAHKFMPVCVCWLRHVRDYVHISIWSSESVQRFQSTLACLTRSISACGSLCVHRWFWGGSRTPLLSQEYIPGVCCQGSTSNHELSGNYGAYLQRDTQSVTCKPSPFSYPLQLLLGSVHRMPVNPLHICLCYLYYGLKL